MKKVASLILCKTFAHHDAGNSKEHKLTEKCKSKGHFVEIFLYYLLVKIKALVRNTNTGCANSTLFHKPLLDNNDF